MMGYLVKDLGVWGGEVLYWGLVRFFWNEIYVVNYV